MSRDVTGRRSATSRTAHATPEDPTVPGVACPVPEAPIEVLEFIRYCYRRRRIGWPELYDEMCAVAARGRYRGMDYDVLAALGIGFSLAELPRLAALSQRIVAEERGARLRAERQVPADAGEGVAPCDVAAVGADVATVVDEIVAVPRDEAARVRSAMMAASAG